MQFSTLAHTFSLDLPAWLEDELAPVPEALPTREERVALVNRLADRNWREGNGGPFAAIIVERESGRIVSVGVNVVLSNDISLGHAEVTAIGMAQQALGTWDLGGEGLPEHELVVNWRPCVQCYGATMWSGITSLVLAGQGPELEELTTFDEGPMIATWAEDFEARGIRVAVDVAKPEAIEVFEQYRAAIDGGSITVYNARSAA
ncbi:deaminase [Microbacterium indicum]|uniref:deaminase n=1 Tax=Microbacterium indicum TaxID=358100 RepID=UPI000413E4DD|nr:nucleoside deaminase [Microbacterium indicum]